MKPLGLNEVREQFLAFFESKGHLRLKSFPLVPINDKSLLLINSGMAPMKAYFTGDEIPPRKRVTTCQKCIRTPDIDNVGKTARHGTFFEMLGNFSFGDYFKKEVIPWAWEFCTDVMEMDPEKLYVTVYLDDDEAHDLWHDVVGVPESHIYRLGKEDNFWEHGTGPCGPCSEIFYDRGEKYGCDNPNCGPGCDCDRYVEFWNLVFTQFDRDESDNYTPLANPNIDTGMGLERLATIMQGVDNIFEVDTIGHVLNYICQKAGVKYGAKYDDDVSIRVITDHVRSVTFMIADGVMPSNEGRGYVLRRLLRRAARHGKLLGIEGLFLYDVAKEVARVSGGAYPELNEKLDYIQKIIKIEEERFKETIDQGLNLLEMELDEIIAQEEAVFPGRGAFKLYDTYGFPFDLTKEIVEERGLTVSIEEFQEAMEEQRARARKAREESDTAVWSDDPFNPLGADALVNFVGYDQLEAQGRIIGLIRDEDLRDNVTAGDEVLVLLDQTAFYAESGGQVGDKGQILGEDGAVIEVTDCKKGSLNRHIHYGKVLSGTFTVGQVVTTKVDKDLRAATQRNHTSTHLLQKALKMVLGDHVEQAGSFVSPTRMRFDFNHFQPMTAEEKRQVEEIVNKEILEAQDVSIFETNIDDARSMGAMALFGEKYGETVRVVKVGDFSIELCGGCHITNSAQVGMFKILSETGVAAGIRRIEAATGMNALHVVEHMDDTLTEVAEALKTAPDSLLERVQEIHEQNRHKEKVIAELKQKFAGNLIADIHQQVVIICGVQTTIAEVDGMDMDELRNVSDMLKDRMGSGIVLLGTKTEDKVNFIATATKDIVKRGFHAGKLIKSVASIAGGGGGGRPDMAQAGGKKPEMLSEALEKAKELIGEQLN
ncbi:alanine--tRNA ligase [Eubacterium aggregans]|uniref:alanine--tRNA ligase n=2 Tax=Eubacterium aggregans TaxID=81409 RepID=UPI0023F190D6|nr:alanine--tRNA ligase [Eubacterium aggregans]MDD4691454.1 alanine--tRNA ligase [Eubacterium aggregans]